ncbi:NAD(P)-binding protein [Thozetella sp. PMI_491]|nr:NAD(P)-binding protein [Thozetella sp. PMI_491]
MALAPRHRDRGPRGNFHFPELLSQDRQIVVYRAIRLPRGQVVALAYITYGVPDGGIGAWSPLHSPFSYRPPSRKVHAFTLQSPRTSRLGPEYCPKSRPSLYYETCDLQFAEPLPDMSDKEGATMRLYQIKAPGPLSQSVKLITAPQPSTTLEEGKILVKVAFAGLNPLDYKVAEGGLVSKIQFRFPKCPGMDFSGVVVAVGAGVPDIKPGDNVMGRMHPFQSGGSLSEYLIASRDDIGVLPGNVTLEQAGGAPTVALTAYQTMAPFVQAGDKVFINGGSGGTGTYAIQVAKALGCQVTVTCSTGKVALCKELGADEIIDYTNTDVAAKLREGGKLYKVAVDNVGKTNLFSIADQFLVPDGRFRLVGAPSSLGTALSLASNMVSSKLLPTYLGGSKHKFDAFVTKNSHEELTQIAEWMGEGKVKTVVDSVFPFEEALKAFEKLKTGSSTGKVLVSVQKEEA